MSIAAAVVLLAALVLVAAVARLALMRNPMTYTAYLKRSSRRLKSDGAIAATGTGELPDSPQPRVLVIGAGFSGLAMCAALKRHGIPFDCVERAHGVGGNWLHGTYDNVHIISSRKTTEYKDFPMPESYPDFPSRDQVLAYLESYAAHFKLNEHIRFNTEVSSIEPAERQPGFWKVSIDGGLDGQREEKVYGGVFLCNGHHWDMRFASYPGPFTGDVIHSKQYKSPSSLAGKRVLVIGGGNSACDIAVEAGRIGAASHISMRRGYWFLPRTIAGIPAVEIIRPWVPIWAQRLLIRAFVKLSIGSYTSYGLQVPDHKIWDHHPTINTELLHYLKLGKIAPHSDITRFAEKTVFFSDGTSCEVDLIVHATGFNVSLKPLRSDLVATEVSPHNGRTYFQLVDGMFPIDQRNLYVVGIGQPRYGAGSLLTVVTELAAEMHLLQPSVSRPVGSLLAAVGGKRLAQKKCVDAHLIDPIDAFNKCLLVLGIVPHLAKIDRLLQLIGR
ncbi:flavin-binding family monooxygenase [Capsaspora owczarzaki ATCC 30864]|uniref:Flavin-binding family monooxygenase n=1 Tax=Capsaspora owczarzaki (strain ATCC 30864) TaxID=595528 RepID=A0A0D2X4S8_CAPO3|nr:flavin-binding family monooxygenase [Capsaspora owczarzaki ATCC 30864]KJE96584.1 flavin-binding family monooxygenase [Capsaspora owczarzaki ATCC 30864]|eukprot:XP_004344508.2 flavin-binding family monooxygenase [Capsaspora owczarzaki ATCC 30864]